MANLLGLVAAYAEMLRELAACDADDLTFLIDLATPQPEDGATEIARIASLIAPGLRPARSPQIDRFRRALVACRIRERGAVAADLP